MILFHMKQPPWGLNKGMQERPIKDAACLKQKEGKTQPPTLIYNLNQNAIFYNCHEVVEVIF